VRRIAAGATSNADPYAAHASWARSIDG
jgi:hypothetical protein